MSSKINSTTRYLVPHLGYEEDGNPPDLGSGQTGFDSPVPDWDYTLTMGQTPSNVNQDSEHTSQTFDIGCSVL